MEVSRAIDFGRDRRASICEGHIVKYKVFKHHGSLKGAFDEGHEGAL